MESTIGHGISCYEDEGSLTESITVICRKSSKIYIGRIRFEAHVNSPLSCSFYIKFTITCHNILIFLLIWNGENIVNYNLEI